MSIAYTDNITVLNAVSITTTSLNFDVSKRQIISLEFVASGGSTTFSLNGSNDGTNWITGIAFLDPTSTSSSTLVVSKSLTSSVGGAIVTPAFRFIQVVATVSSGTATAVMETQG